MYGSLLSGWTPEIREALLEQLNDTSGEKKIAALDFDNTCIYNDISETAFFHLIRDRGFAFTEAFWEAIPKNCGRDDIRANFEASRTIPYPDALEDLAYRRYRYGFQRLYFRILETEGVGVAFRFAGRVFAGLTPGELVEVGRTVIEREEANPRGEVEIEDPDGAGPPVTVRRGLRINPLLKDAILAFSLSGVEVYLVTGSASYLVAPYAQRLGIGLSRIIGTSLEREADGTFSNRLIEPAPTYQTKVDAVQTYIGRAPNIVIGDSQWDGPMMSISLGPKIFVRHGTHAIPDEVAALNPLVQPCPEFPSERVP